MTTDWGKRLVLDVSVAVNVTWGGVAKVTPENNACPLENPWVGKETKDPSDADNRTVGVKGVFTDDTTFQYRSTAFTVKAKDSLSLIHI